MGHEQHTVTVFAPALYLTVTIEQGSADDGDEIHIHPGGQGFWIGRMLKHLGERPLLCGPLGGEAGRVFLGLVAHFGMDSSTIDVSADTPAVVSDRRSGDRTVVAESPGLSLARHEMDDVYGRFLDRALASSLCVVVGQSNEIFAPDTFRRLGHDLAAGGVEVVADLHGPELIAFLEGGPVEILKVSDEDLVGHGLLDEVGADDRSASEAMATLISLGARAVVLSRQERPALARFANATYVAIAPELDPADHRGAGDSMTAGLAAALRRGLGPEETLRLACAAGAANVTRHGLGSAEESLVPSLSEKIEVHRADSVPA